MLQKYNPKNSNLFVYVKDKLVSRNEAKVSVFDSSVQGGDAVWEGLRIYNGKIFSLEEHLNRLHASAKTLAFTDIPSKEKIKAAIFETLIANGMHDGAHIRLTLTRGEKITSGMDPRLNQAGSCLIVLAEWKEPVYDNQVGIKLVTSQIRRNSPQILDSKIHHNNLLNNILAKIEANYAKVDDALMLDLYGFVAETNSCNIFMIKGAQLYTPFATSCLPGITRQVIINCAAEQNIKCSEGNYSVSEFYNADVVFTTGTMGELTPVCEIDGRKIENKTNSKTLEALQIAFRKKTEKEGELIPF